ncbi:efflux RND transporter periplasmic adaptor subunit [Petrocella sp. FN5]|uniref:efflux RND transporter periplasmic adaptor subunit n=1 Tax=Petrocella sp. FN5 TaxID=3032002 RepID=UPI0023DB98B6|nr:efflux RND transporter periplasmic adaptor subunit [Petrocella sp. FN5]MDF1618029.1 efflux RND transporter periplasmic adaptor subunit [Petrocella sp. FN5]
MKKKLIIAFVIFISIGLGLFYLLTMGNIGVKYNTVEVKKGEAGIYVQDIGRISSKNIRRYYGNGVDKVEQMTLKLGDHVKKGQALIIYEADTDTVDLEVQKIEKQIEALEAIYKDAKSGTDIQSINNARIEISKIESQIDTATKDKERIETLYNEGIVSLLELEESLEIVEKLQSSLEIARNNYNRLTKGISGNIRQKYEADIDALLLSIEILEKRKEDNIIFADIEGIVTEINTFEGDKPSAGIMMLEIQDPTEKVVLVDFMVEDAIRMRPGLEAKIEDQNLDLKIDNLKVNQIHPKAFVTLSELGVKENRQTVQVDLPTSDHTLAFGLEVETMVMIEPPREMLLIPVGAVVEKNSKQYVEILLEGEPVEREILTGIHIEGNIEVISGVEEGDQVILNYQNE